MPNKYTRKTTQQSWDANAMREAIEAVKRGEMGFLKASKQFQVPRSTLKRRVKGANKIATGYTKGLGSRRPVFSAEQETELLAHILDMERRFYGLTLDDVRRLAYQLAVKNKLNHNFNENKEMAGKIWAQGFRKRHPEITLRSPEATSLARAQGFNKINVMAFMDLLEEARTKISYTAHRIYNVDETGCTTVQSKSTKILALKGKKQVGAITSAERGILSTVVMCMGAGGNFIPPFIIFPRKRMKAELMDGAPPGTAFACHSSGWMQLEIFTEWFKHFLKFAKPSADDPVLLLLDGHNTHTKNIDFIEMARENYTTVIVFPPHCTHRLQPLDVAFMGPFNKYYIRAIEKYLRNHPGRAITTFQLSKLLGEAYPEAAQQTIAINGFKKCGIEPLDRNIFKESDFMPSQTTEMEPPPHSKVTEISQDPENAAAELTVPGADLLTLNPKNADDEPDTNTSINIYHEPGTTTPRNMSPEPATNILQNIDLQPSTSSFVEWSPGDLFPIPKAPPKVRKLIRKKGKTVILTSSPYKQELLEEKRKQEEKSAQKRLPKLIGLKENSKKKGKILAKPAKTKNMDKSGDRDDADAVCFYCMELWSASRTNDGWIKCKICNRWAHEACSGCDDDDDEFMCEFCA